MEATVEVQVFDDVAEWRFIVHELFPVNAFGFQTTIAFSKKMTKEQAMKRALTVFCISRDEAILRGNPPQEVVEWLKKEGRL